MKHRTIESVGWYGTIAIIAAYAMTSFNILDSSSTWYQILNLTGAVGIIAASFYKKAYQPAVLNIIWTIIALISIGKIILSN